MSYTETHIGTFKVIARGKENVKKYLTSNNIPFTEDKWNGIELEYDYEHYKDRKYELIRRNIDKNSFEDILIEFIRHIDYGENSPGIEEFYTNEDGTVDFTVQFYNGGTYLGEVLGYYFK